MVHSKCGAFKVTFLIWSRYKGCLWIIVGRDIVVG